MTGECAECRKKRLRLQRNSAHGNDPSPVPLIVHEVLSSPGQPLDHSTRAFMESRFGHDFSRVSLRTNKPQQSQTSLTLGLVNDHFEQEADRVAATVMQMPATDVLGESASTVRFDFSQVRVHTNAKAVESARAVNAQAYTVGQHIVFGEGKFAPWTSLGKRLLAHELTHVAQQTIHDQHPSTLQRQTRVTLATEGSCVDARAIAEAIPGARAMANTALNWFLSFNPTDRARVDLLLRANFLSDSDETYGIVKHRIARIGDCLSAAQNGSMTFVCAPTSDPECGDREGYVLDTERDRIHICRPFFGLTLEGRRWMLIHECAHQAGARRLPEHYWGIFGPVGESECRQLTSLSSTREALGNADNYTRLVWCLTRQPGIEITPP